jgi:hypothetical protein
MDKARGCRRNASASGFKGVGLALAAVAAPGVACAADVTYERLLNPEPQNWLHHHRDFGAQRHSPLTAIDKTNIKNLKLAFAVPLGGKSAGESLEATPLVDDTTAERRARQARSLVPSPCSIRSLARSRNAQNSPIRIRPAR